MDERQSQRINWYKLVQKGSCPPIKRFSKSTGNRTGKQNRNKEMIWKKGKNRRRKQQSKEENQNFIVALFPFYVQYREAFKWRFYWTGFGVDLGAADWQSKQRDGITYSGSENRGGR